MWLAAIALAGGGLAGLALGGRLRHLGRIGLRRPGLLVAGAAIELVGSRWGGPTVGLTALIAGYVVLILFALTNIPLTGMVLVAAGLTANLAVIALDHGMPVRGVPAGLSDGPRHHGQTPSDRLTGLGDVVSIAPLGQTVSGGDLVLAAGVGAATASLVRGRSPAGRRPAPGRMGRWAR